MTDTQLETLEEKGLVKLATIRPELEYLFRHALVQDAAYGSLLKQERRQLHGQVGEALETLYPDRVGELAPVLAMHFEQAGETDKAIEYFVVGGQHALQQNAIQEAFGAFDQASILIAREPAPADASPDVARARLRRQVEVDLGRADAGYTVLPVDESLGALEGAVERAEELGDIELITRIHVLIALGRLQSGESPESPPVARSLRRLEEIGEQQSDPSILAMPLAFVGLSQVFAGPVRDGVKALEQAVPLMQQRHDSIGAAFARGGLAMGYASLGEFDKADAAVRDTKEFAAKSDLIAQLDALIAESAVRAAEGRLDLAVPIARECVDRAEKTGASACVLASSWILGDALHRLGEFAAAKDVLQRGADVAMAVDRQVWRPTLQSWLRTTTAALGEISQDEDWDEALETSRRIGNHVGEAGILGKRAEAEAEHGDIEAAEADYRAAIGLLDGLGMRPAMARGLLSWGNALRRAGRTTEAAPILDRSIALFEELGLDREAAAARTILGLGGARIAFS